jgi:hypothetical protein
VVEAALAAGILPLCLVSGALALRGSAPGPRGSARGTGRAKVRATPFAFVVLSLGAGIGLLTPVLLLLAALGGFSPAAIGAAGWAAGALALVARWRLLSRPRFRAADVLVLACAATFVVVATGGRDEPWGAGRDQQVYAAFAAGLAAHGRPWVAPANLDAADRELVAAVADDPTARRLAAIVRTVRGGETAFASYLPLAWPVWLAFGHAIGGADGLAAMNSVVLALAALVVYVLATRLVGRVLAAGAAASLLSLPACRWIAGVTLSEPLAMLLIATLAALPFAAGRRAAAPMALVAFAAVSIRVEALLAVAAMLVANLLDGADGAEREDAGVGRLAGALLAGSLAAIAVLATTHPDYLSDKSRYVLPGIALCAVLAVAASPPVRSFRRRVAKWILSPAAAWSAIAVLLVAFVYAATLRPTAEPFALIQNGSPLDGTRDYREESVRNLAAYVGWPLLLAALAGVCLALQRWRRRDAGFARRAFLLLALTASAVVLWFPHVSPDHPWASRRFVPVVLPAVVVLAAYAFRRAARRIAAVRAPAPARGREHAEAEAATSGAAASGAGTFGAAAFGAVERGAIALGAITLVALSLQAAFRHGSEVPSLRESAGFGVALDGLARALPDTLVVADRAAERVAGPLLVAHGKSVLPVDVNRAATREALLRWIDAKSASGRQAWLLHAPVLPLAGLRATRVALHGIDRVHAAPVVRAPSTKAAHESLAYAVTGIAGLDREALFRRFGAEPMWGVAERGFLAPELTTHGVLRLTDGRATLSVAADAVREASALHLDFFLWAPDGKPRRTRVAIDGGTEWQGDVPPGPGTVHVAVGTLPSGTRRNIVIESDTFDTRTLDRMDTRGPVGVAVLGMRFERDTPRRDDDPSMAGFASRLVIDPRPGPGSVARNGESAFALEATNIGTRAWPSLREHGVAGAVQIGIRWYLGDESAGAPATPPLAADNRWALALTVLPGESVRTRVPLVPVGVDGARLPPGRYRVQAGLVRERHAWFADGGDPLVTFEVEVTP